MKNIRIAFTIILLINLYLTYTGNEVFPSIKFPHFECRNFDGEIVFQEVILKDKKEKKLDIFDFVQPYDKRFVLFSLRFLSEQPTRKQMVRFLNTCRSGQQGDIDRVYLHTKRVKHTELE